MEVDVTNAERRLEEAKKALNEENNSHAKDCADGASRLAKRSNVGRVKISELNEFPTKYDQKGVIVIGSISEIVMTGLNPRTFILHDGSGTVLVEYMTLFSTTIDYAKVGDIVIFGGTFYASGASGERIYGGPVLHIPRVAFAILGLLAVAYLMRRRKKQELKTPK